MPKRLPQELGVLGSPNFDRRTLYNGEVLTYLKRWSTQGRILCETASLTHRSGCP